MSGPGYTARLRAAFAAVREVRAAYQADQAALLARARAVLDGRGRMPAGDRDGGRDVVGERCDRLFEMVDESFAGLRAAVWGQRVDSAALIERARELSASAAAVYRLDPATAPDDTPADADAADADAGGVGVDAEAGLAGPVEDVPVERAGPEPVLADWPPWQDAQRMRDPDLDAVEAVFDEITATDPQRWRSEFAEADELTDIAEDVAHERDRPPPHDLTHDTDTNDGTDDDGDDDRGGDGGARRSGEVPDPLEQARQALAAVRLDLAADDTTHTDHTEPGGVWRDIGTDDGLEDQR